MKISSFHNPARSLGLAVAMALSVVGSVQAGTITFDTLNESGAALADGDQTSAQGFTFELNSGNENSFFVAGLESQGSYASNGTSSLYAANDADIVLSGTSPFNLRSFELGGGNLAFVDPLLKDTAEPWAVQLDLIGTTAGNLMLMTSFLIDPLSSGLTSFMVNWENLTQVQFSVAGGDYSLDNIDLKASGVPEPGSLALLSLGMAGLIRLRRRRSQSRS